MFIAQFFMISSRLKAGIFTIINKMFAVIQNYAQLENYKNNEFSV